METKADIGAIRMWCVDMALEITDTGLAEGVIKVAKEIEAYIARGISINVPSVWEDSIVGDAPPFDTVCSTTDYVCGDEQYTYTDGKAHTDFGLGNSADN